MEYSRTSRQQDRDRQGWSSQRRNSTDSASEILRLGAGTPIKHRRDQTRYPTPTTETDRLDSLNNLNQADTSNTPGAKAPHSAEPETSAQAKEASQVVDAVIPGEHVEVIRLSTGREIEAVRLLSGEYAEVMLLPTGQYTYKKPEALETVAIVTEDPHRAGHFVLVGSGGNVLARSILNEETGRPEMIVYLGEYVMLAQGENGITDAYDASEMIRFIPQLGDKIRRFRASGTESSQLVIVEDALISQVASQPTAETEAATTQSTLSPESAVSAWPEDLDVYAEDEVTTYIVDSENTQVVGYEYIDGKQAAILDRVVRDAETRLLQFVGIAENGSSAPPMTIAENASVSYQNNEPYDVFVRRDSELVLIPSGATLTFSAALGDEIISFLSPDDSLLAPENASAETPTQLDAEPATAQRPPTESAPTESAPVESAPVESNQVLLQTLRGSASGPERVNQAERSQNDERESPVIEASASGVQHAQQLADNVDNYRTALFTQLPAATERHRAAAESGLFQADTVSAWVTLSNLIIATLPASKADRDSLPGSDIIAAINSFYPLLQRDLQAKADALGGIPGAVAGADDQISYFITEKNWIGFYRKFYHFVTGISHWLVNQSDYRGQEEEREAALSTDKEDIEQLEALNNAEVEATESRLSYHQRLESFVDEHREMGLQPITAYFSPQAEEDVSVPLTLYYWEENGEWHLSQITPTDTFENKINKSSAQEEAPPVELFEQLNSKKRFARGTVDYQLLNGETGSVEVEGGMTWADWLAASGLGASLLGVGLVVGGAVSKNPSMVARGVVALRVGAIASGTSAGLDILEEFEHGSPDPLQVSIDVAEIASSLLSIAPLSVNSTNLASIATERELTGLLRYSDRLFVPFTQASVAADAVSLALLTTDTVRKVDEIKAGEGQEEDKKRAVIILLSRVHLTYAR
ncbi:MAG: hypothetical protein AAFO84_11410 [Cyanobacteria bacterium J06598_1]